MNRRAGQGVGALLGGVAIALLLVCGCGSSPVTSPGQPEAAWDSLELLDFTAPDTLVVRGDATLEFHAIEAPVEAGILSPAEFSGLMDAVERAELSPLGEWPAGLAGAIVVVREGVRSGFAWQAPGELTPLQGALRARLAELRDEVRGEGSERVAILPTSVFAAGRQARVAERTARVIRDRDGLVTLLGEELRGEPLLLAEVDFAREMLLAVFAGASVRSGSQLEIATQVSRTAGGYLLVPVTLHEPGPACEGTIPESPFQIVRMQRIEAEIYFQWERLETSCPEAAGEEF